MQKFPKAGLGTIFVVVILIMLIGNMMVVVPAGHVGITMLWGKVDNTPLSEGLHIINPLKNVVQMSVQYNETTMNRTSGQGIDVLARDGLEIGVDLTIRYRIDPSEAPNIYRTIGVGYVNKILTPSIRSAARESASNYLAQNIYSVDRDAFVADFSLLLDEEISGMGIIIDRIQIRDITLPETIKLAIETKLTAEQEYETMQHKISIEEATAEQRLIEAQGIAGANNEISNSLTNEYLQWYYINTMSDLAGSDNTTWVILPMDSNLVPLLDMGGGS